MKIKTDYDGCPYITAGKEYELAKVGNNEGWIICDDGDDVFVNLCDCCHIHGHNWQVEERFSQEVAQEMYDTLVNILGMKGNVNYTQDGAEHDLSDIFEIAGSVVNKLEKNDE